MAIALPLFLQLARWAPLPSPPMWFTAQLFLHAFQELVVLVLMLVVVLVFSFLLLLSSIPSHPIPSHPNILKCKITENITYEV